LCEEPEALVLGAVVIREGRIQDVRQLVNVASAIIKKKEGVSEDIKIKEVVFFPRTRVYVAVYERPSCRMASLGVQGRKVKQ